LAQLFLLGGLRLDGPDGAFVDADLPGPQGRVALAVLAVERRALSRDALAEIVWDGRLPSKWEGALSTIISKLRSLISSTGIDGKQAITTTGGTYSLVLPPGTWVDLEDAIRRLDRAEGALRHGDLDTATTDGTVASGVLRRTFLAGVDGEWVDAQRRRVHALDYRCSVALARAWIDRGDPSLAVTIAEHAIGLDPLREVAHRLVATAELARGDRAAAMRALTRCEQILADELGISPSAETAALVDRLR
jgi:DNA-binding SARP family transcriptional activator